MQIFFTFLSFILSKWLLHTYYSVFYLCTNIEYFYQVSALPFGSLYDHKHTQSPATGMNNSVFFMIIFSPVTAANTRILAGLFSGLE